ncbi:MAG: hypothetical protein KAJ40_08025 [Alphaproteobacteria bacterium]|nr:hypothetical protein [Alphaproteobacteria bacterium]
MTRKRLKTLEDRVSYRIARSKQNVFVREDFEDLGGYDQIGRALRLLAKSETLIKIGYGLYAKAKKSTLSSKTVPVKPLPSLAKEAIERLGLKTSSSKLERDYNAGRTTQVPTGRLIAVRGRISRRIGYNGAYVSYERAAAR